MHAEIPPADDSSDPAVERMLRALPVASLPPAWRATILDALPPAPVSTSTTASPSPPPGGRFFTKKFVSLMAGIWGLNAAFLLTTPEPPPPPPGAPASAPARAYPPPFSYPPDPAGSDPWLAQNRIPLHTRLP